MNINGHFCGCEYHMNLKGRNIKVNLCFILEFFFCLSLNKPFNQKLRGNGTAPRAFLIFFVDNDDKFILINYYCLEIEVNLVIDRIFVTNSHPGIFSENDYAHIFTFSGI